VSHRFTIPLVLLAACGCSTAVPIDTLQDEGAIEVRLDANARMHQPGRKIKFFVDITNRSERSLDLAALNVELQARTDADARSGPVRLRQDWTYKWEQEMLLPPGKRITVPIVPEAGVEFRLEMLEAGKYAIVAVVNGRHTSAPYALVIARPDLVPELRRV